MKGYALSHERDRWIAQAEQIIFQQWRIRDHAGIREELESLYGYPGVTPAQAAGQACDRVARFNAYEFHPCREFEDEDGQIFVEQVNEDHPVISFWGVYGHLAPPFGGLQWISDHPTREEAQAACKELEATL